MEPYQYTPLEQGQIRLLQILPGLEANLVFCQLFTVSFDNIPEYTALSYAWGTGAADKTIIVDGKVLSIGTNLDDSLRELRSRPVWTGLDRGPRRIYSVLKGLIDINNRYSPPGWDSFMKGNLHRFKRGIELMSIIEDSNDDDQNMQIIAEMCAIATDLEEAWEGVALRDGVPRIHRDMPLIWIDAICINQEDTVERMEQVKLMGKIFKGAYSLTVWLGAEADESSKAVSLLKQMKLEIPEVGDTGAYYDIKLLDPGVQDMACPILKLFSRPWFGRLWILQEYALGGHTNMPGQSLGNHVMFCCGRDRIEDLVALGNDVLEKVTASLVLAQKSMVLLAVNRNVSIHLLRLLVTFSKRVGAIRNQLLSLVIQSSTAYATDPRDKIYACIGLAEEIFQGPPLDLDFDSLIFDYAAPVEDVYSSFVRAVVSATNRLDLLGLCTGKSSLVTRTWTPDWTTPFTGILCLDLATILTNLQLLTYDVTPGIDCVARFGPDLSTLTVGGFVWEVVMEVTSVFGVNIEAQVKTECVLISNIAKNLSISEQVERELDHYTSFAKTMAWNRTHEREGGAMPQSWVRSLKDWLVEHPSEEHILSLESVSTPPNEGVLCESDFLEALHKTMRSENRIFVTNRGCIGRTESEVKRNDLVCLILGCAMPMILRPVENHYEVVGEVYLDEIMHEEGMVALREGKRTLQEFELH
ncbi:heterokaryon incompatibility protein-domain-containing protein [Rhexocercosporidium sp. MPI-PUGE-AT-0058]|nr:heterokaryon incompatibility protein-domain-containing protein [Rhexocercosporidium sp. MPI-PUGE-AT-0058]